MKSYRYAIVIVNGILFLFFWWLSWLGDEFLPGQLNSEMKSDVMLQKYQNVCADLTASLTVRCLLIIILVNAVLVPAYFLLKRNMASSASSNKTSGGDLLKAAP